MLFVFEHEDKARLATFRTKVIQTEWKPLAEWEIKLTGLNLDSVWENIIVQIGGLQIRNSEFGIRNCNNEYIYYKNIDDALAADDERAKLLRRIEQLEKQARNEKQPRRKWELAEEIKKLKQEMEDNLYG
jgi:hypothetical protein